jgi:transcriptional regulator with XRE-family HTH domain
MWFEIISEVVRRANLPQREVGRALGISQSAASRKLRGKTEWTLGDIAALNAILPDGDQFELVYRTVASKHHGRSIAPRPRRFLPPGSTFDKATGRVLTSPQLRAERLAAIEAAIADGAGTPAEVAGAVGVSAQTVRNMLRAKHGDWRLAFEPPTNVGSLRSPEYLGGLSGRYLGHVSEITSDSRSPVRINGFGSSLVGVA